MAEPTPCPVCGEGELYSASTERVFTVDGHTITFMSDIDVCTHCSTEMQTLDMMQRDVDRRAELKRQWLEHNS